MTKLPQHVNQNWPGCLVRGGKNRHGWGMVKKKRCPVHVWRTNTPRLLLCRIFFKSLVGRWVQPLAVTYRPRRKAVSLLWHVGMSNFPQRPPPPPCYQDSTWSKPTTRRRCCFGQMWNYWFSISILLAIGVLACLLPPPPLPCDGMHLPAGKRVFLLCHVYTHARCQQGGDDAICGVKLGCWLFLSGR